MKLNTSAFIRRIAGAGAAALVAGSLILTAAPGSVAATRPLEGNGRPLTPAIYPVPQSAVTQGR